MPRSPSPRPPGRAAAPWWLAAALAVAGSAGGCEGESKQRTTGSVAHASTGAEAGSSDGSSGDSGGFGTPRDPAPLDAICFAPATTLPWPGAPPLGVDDVTGDGAGDVVVAGFRDGTRTATVHLGAAGEARWTTSVQTPIVDGERDVLADADADGIVDLLVVGDAVTVYRGTASGELVQAEASTPLTDFRSFGLVDFDRDGAIDLVAVGFDETLHTLRGTGTGQFDPVGSTAITAPMGGALIYTDRSGGTGAGLIVGLAAGCVECEESSFSLLRVTADGSVAPTGLISWGGAWSMILPTVGQLFGGGTPEVIVDFGIDQRTVFTQTAGELDVGGYLPNGPLAFGDVNGDGEPELVLHDGSSLGIYTDGGDAVVKARTAAAPAAPQVHATDLDADGWADVVLVDPVNYDAETGLPDPVIHVVLSTPC